MVLLCELTRCVQQDCTCDEGNARVSCSKSSISKKKVTPRAMWKVRATIAQPASKYVAFQNMVIVMKVSCFSVNGHCKGKYSTFQQVVLVKNILLLSNWL